MVSLDLIECDLTDGALLEHIGPAIGRKPLALDGLATARPIGDRSQAAAHVIQTVRQHRNLFDLYLDGNPITDDGLMQALEEAEGWLSVDCLSLTSCEKLTTGLHARLLEHNTLLVEAGCSAEKTRKLIKWLTGELSINPYMPVIFITTRKTHADDLAATLAHAGLTGFKNYLDANSTDMSKTEYLSDATRLIVSLQSIALVNLELYRGGVVVMDEVRSLAAIPGGGTLDNTTRLTEGVRALETLCSGAKYRVAMDADVSADGAVRDWLRLVAPRFNVLHVQLRKAALKREVHMGFTASKKSALIMKMRVKLALHHAHRSRAEAMEGEAGDQLRAAAVAVIDSLVRVVRGAAGDYVLPRRKDGGARDAPVEWRAVSWGLARRRLADLVGRELDSGAGGGGEGHASGVNVKSAFTDARSGVCRLIQRVFVIASRPSQADAVVKMADAIGARVAVDEGKYSGKGSDATKRAHFKDTTGAWCSGRTPSSPPRL